MKKETGFRTDWTLRAFALAALISSLSAGTARALEECGQMGGGWTTSDAEATYTEGQSCPKNYVYTEKKGQNGETIKVCVQKEGCTASSDICARFCYVKETVGGIWLRHYYCATKAGSC